MHQLTIGVADRSNKTFRLPADFVTQTASIIARKGAGKTYTGSVFAEELLTAGEQVVVLDPLDVWWGLRSSADGKSKGFPIVVFGGEHGDLPLTENMGAQLADAIVDLHLSAVLSLDHLSKNGQRAFATAFAEQLYQKKNPAAARSPMHLIIDEADMFCPQRVHHGQERMLGSIDSLVRRGRTRGIGVTMITQRPATIHKDVFTQTEMLIALQLTSPQDRKAVEEWVEGNDAENHSAEFMGSLASLRVGQAWVWSPSWLRCFERVKIRERTTFNSSATPKAGDRPKTPKARAEVDLGALRQQIAFAIEEATANDPAVLKKEIAKLKQELTAAKKAPPPGPYRPTSEEVQREVQSAVLGERQRFAVQLAEALKPLDELRATRQWMTLTGKSLSPIKAKTFPVETKPLMPSPWAASTKSHRKAAPPPTTASSELTKGERAVLIVLAQAKEAGQDLVSIRKAALRAGYSLNSSTWRNILSRLRSGHGEPYINTSEGVMSVTEPALAALGSYTPLPTGKALLDYWKGELGGGVPGRVFQALVDVYPNELSKENLAAAAGCSSDSSTFRNALSKLNTLELMARRGDLRSLSPELMEDE